MVDPPPSKRSKSSCNDDDKERSIAKQSYEHYKNYIEGDDEEEDDEEEGDIDQLLEVIEILGPIITPFAAGPSTDNKNDVISLLSDIKKSLLPILMSMSYLQLASHAMSYDMHDNEDNDNNNTSPKYYFNQSLHYWSTNPAAHSLLANYHRMNKQTLSSIEDICELYVKASEYAKYWRGVALEFLQTCNTTTTNDEDSLGGVDTKEWVELLILNGSLDVDYIGSEEQDNEEEEDGEARVDEEKSGNDTDEYSSSDVEATASFMSAFLLSIMGKHDDVLTHLNKFHLSHRIHPNVWKAAQSHNSNDQLKLSSAAIQPSSSVLFSPRMYYNNNGVLPSDLYHDLCNLFAPDAKYWVESDYNNRGYYSYYIDLEGKTNDSKHNVRDCPSNVMEDVIVNHLLPLAERTLQESNAKSSSQKIVGAEWWTHTRPISANLGHPLHFDTDEVLLQKEKKVSHPIISSVLYLTGAGGGGGSTVVFDQTPESTEVAKQAWISQPMDNAFMVFPGNLLHGVLPCDGADSDGGDVGSANRLTLMVGFWTRDVTKEVHDKRSLYSPCGPMPPSNTPQHTWVSQSQKGYNHSKPKNKYFQASEVNVLPSASPAWEKFKQIPERDDTFDATSLAIPKSLDHKFFVSNAPRCFSESLLEKEDCF